MASAGSRSSLLRGRERVGTLEEEDVLDRPPRRHMCMRRRRIRVHARGRTRLVTGREPAITRARGGYEEGAASFRDGLAPTSAAERERACGAERRAYLTTSGTVGPCGARPV